MEKKMRNRYAWTVKVGDKGQIVIPKEARDVFDIEEGDTILILGDNKQGMAIPTKARTEKIISRIFGKDDEK